MFRTFIILLSICGFAFAQNGNLYTLTTPPDVITMDRVESVSIVTRAEMELGDLPDHPKITWLGYSSVRIPQDRFGNMQTDNRVYFIANTPGIVDFPPIPIVLENKEFFIRIGELQVEPNEASESDTALQVLWNDSPEIPAQVHLGEAVEVEFIELIKSQSRRRGGAPYFSQPINRVEGGQWHQFTRVPARKPIPSDYFFNHGRRSIFSSRFAPLQNYQSLRREIEGDNYDLRIYTGRLYFTKIGITRGTLSATLGTSGRRSTHRTHLIPFEIEVLPIPPMPNDQAFDTGLVGDWEFEAAFSPRQPQASRPFTISLAISGQGNPNLRNDFDFSTAGFPSVESELRDPETTNYRFWEATFSQTLLPTGKVGTYPSLVLASFDTIGDQWRFQEIVPTLTLPGFTSETNSRILRTQLNEPITRPILLNLPTATFGAFALAPFLPFLLGLLKKRLDARDPEERARRLTLQKLISHFEKGQGTATAIDEDLLPILRHHLQLPAGATAREIADAIEQDEVASALRTHAESSFSATAKPIDFAALARGLSKLSLLFLFCLGTLRGATLEEANTAFEQANYREAITTYQALITDSPNQPSLHFNLAQAQLAVNAPAKALASCHTALLLDPLDGQARELLDQIRNRLGDETVSRNRFLDLRPDQWIIIASLLWCFAFLYLGLRKLRPLPLWPAPLILVFSFGLLATAAWRNQHAYQPNQYMVLADELPREPTAGTPDWNYPALRAGQIVEVSETNETHAKVTSSETSFWLPIQELQKVW